MVSEAFVRFFVEIVGHYSLFLTAGEREERTLQLQREAFRKAVSSKSLRRGYLNKAGLKMEWELVKVAIQVIYRILKL